MKKLPILALLSLAFASLAQALTVAAYNVENYLVADRQVDGVYRSAYPKPEKEKRALRQAIAGIAPDLLAIEEMGKQPFLDELQRDLKAEGQDYPFATVLEAGDPDRHVAVLSKLPFKEVVRHAVVPITLFGQKDAVKRGVLEVTVATTAGDLTIFIIHLKSQRTERKEDPRGVKQRQLEAEAVRDVVFARFPDPAKGKFIVCGDWNDARNSRAVHALTKRGKTELGDLLRAADTRGETWTHFFRQEESYSRLDYILVSAELKPFVVGGRATIYDGPGSTNASDHRPVSVKFELDPAK